MRLGREFIDMDEEIELREGRPCAEIVAENETRFRRLERDLLDELLEERADTIIAAGGGLDTFSTEPLVVWLYRDDWTTAARDERQRLRPEIEWADEVEWMRSAREPRFAAAADVRYDVSRGRTTGWAARDVATLIEWCDAARSSRFAQKTWVVPSTPEHLVASVARARALGLAGVEIRSDVFESFSAIGVPALASIRTDDEEWLADAVEDADAFDIDVELYSAARDVLFAAAPRRLIVSAHPGRCDPEDVKELARVAREIQERYPPWAGHTELKYAPVVSSLEEVGLARAMIAPLRRAGLDVTFLPQGDRFAGLRPLLLGENTTNYVASTLRPSRADGRGPATLTPLDLQDWLPHFAGEAPTRWDVLIGDPAIGSQGDVWHRRAALEAGDHESGYAKVQVPREEFDSALDLLAALDVRGLSVTSPLKRHVQFLCPDDATFGDLLDPETAAGLANHGAPIRTGNTLARTDSGWRATDTDEDGMAATLEHLEARGFGPGTIAIFGRGGVSSAVLRAIERSDWFLAAHVSARQGWGEDAPRRVDVVIDASGGAGEIDDGAPDAKVWVDLRYSDVPDPPEAEAVELLNGDVFFEGQAQRQREFWNAWSPGDH
jgi:shikimate kinase